MTFRLSSDEGRGEAGGGQHLWKRKGFSTTVLYCVVSRLARARIGTRIFAPQVTTTCLERTACHAQAGQSQFSFFFCMYTQGGQKRLGWWGRSQVHEGDDRQREDGEERRRYCLHPTPQNSWAGREPPQDSAVNSPSLPAKLLHP